MADRPGSATGRYGPASPERELFDQVANRWSFLITDALEHGICKFSDLRDTIGISSGVLSRNLRELERNGMVQRDVIGDIPVRVEYSLTESGSALQSVVEALWRFAEDMLDDVATSRARYDMSDG